MIENSSSIPQGSRVLSNRRWQAKGGSLLLAHGWFLMREPFESNRIDFSIIAQRITSGARVAGVDKSGHQSKVSSSSCLARTA
jgi:hypothetical protein